MQERGSPRLPWLAGGSNAVSRKVGYVGNGVQRAARREGEWQYSQQLLLIPDAFVRGEPITVSGVEAFRKFIGLGA